MHNSRHWLTAERALLYAKAMLLFSTLLSAGFIYDYYFTTSTGAARADNDFIAFHAASQLAASGMPAAAYDIAQLHQTAQADWPAASPYLWLYPPTYLLAITPLSLLSPHTAYLAFMGLTLLLYAYATHYMCRNKAMLIAALAFPAVPITMIYGQNALLTTALLMAGLSLLDRRPRLSGLLLGMLVIKPHLGLLIPLALALDRRWQTLFSAALAALGLMLLSLLLFGEGSWLAFFQSIDKARGFLEAGNLPWERMTSVFADIRLMGGSTSVAYGLHGLIALLFCGGMIAIWRRSQEPALRISALVVASLTLSPYQYDYDLLWLCIPLLLLLQRGLQQGWSLGERELLAAIWLFPLVDLLFLHKMMRPNTIVLFELLLMLLIMSKLRASSGAGHKEMPIT